MSPPKIMTTNDSDNHHLQDAPYNNVCKTQDLCDLFSSTISSLAMDAEALKQLTSLKLAVEMDLAGQNPPKRKENHHEGTITAVESENSNPNIVPDIQSNNDDKRSTYGNGTTINQLRKIDSLVTELEKKMCILGGIVEEEKQSLVDLENVCNAAKAQNEVLKDMLACCDNITTTENNNKENARHDYRPQISHVRKSTSTTSSISPTSTNQGVTPRRTSSSNHKPLTQISIPRVTNEEMESISRNIRGRIHLAVVNEAVEEIEGVCRDKYKAIYAKGHYSKKRLPMKIEQNRRNQITSHRELEVGEHGDRPWVAETSLRQSCAFFRSGESTARAILTILRTLKRLKQIPAKHSQITYVIL